MNAQMLQDKNQWIVSAEDGTYTTFLLPDEPKARELYEKKLKEKKP